MKKVLIGLVTLSSLSVYANEINHPTCRLAALSSIDGVHFITETQASTLKDKGYKVLGKTYYSWTDVQGAHAGTVATNSYRLDPYISTVDDIAEGDLLLQVTEESLKLKGTLSEVEGSLNSTVINKKEIFSTISEESIKSKNHRNGQINLDKLMNSSKKGNKITSEVISNLPNCVADDNEDSALATKYYVKSCFEDLKLEAHKKNGKDAVQNTSMLFTGIGISTAGVLNPLLLIPGITLSSTAIVKNFAIDAVVNKRIEKRLNFMDALSLCLFEEKPEHRDLYCTLLEDTSSQNKYRKKLVQKAIQEFGSVKNYATELASKIAEDKGCDLSLKIRRNSKEVLNASRNLKK